MSAVIENESTLSEFRSLTAWPLDCFNASRWAFKFCFHFPGLQVLLPEYLRSRFVQAALSYIACNGEGRFACQDNDCWCQCSEGHPQCNCPHASLQAQHSNLEHTNEAWRHANQEFEQSGARRHLTLFLFQLQILSNAEEQNEDSFFMSF